MECWGNDQMSGLFSSRWFRIYIVPGAVIQSVMVGGGYGTGRETVEYFTNFGFLGGAMGIGVIGLPKILKNRTG